MPFLKLKKIQPSDEIQGMRDRLLQEDPAACLAYAAAPNLPRTQQGEAHGSRVSSHKASVLQGPVGIRSLEKTETGRSCFPALLRASLTGTVPRPPLGPAHSWVGRPVGARKACPAPCCLSMECASPGPWGFLPSPDLTRAIALGLGFDGIWTCTGDVGTARQTPARISAQNFQSPAK